jgi:conserved oligomeric Golgi complex subunit 4
MLRLLSTGSVTTVKRLLEQIRDVMERDYISVLKRKMDDVYRGSNASAASARSEKTERENRIAFMVRTDVLDSNCTTLNSSRRQC